LISLAKAIGVKTDKNIRDIEVDVDRIFEIEKTTQHDVKAVELAVRERVPKELAPFVRSLCARGPF
jgi:adenylosuccinate lyase